VSRIAQLQRRIKGADHAAPDLLHVVVSPRSAVSNLQAQRLISKERDMSWPTDADIERERIAKAERDIAAMEASMQNDEIELPDGGVGKRYRSTADVARIAELEAALRDCIAFVAIIADKHKRDFGLTELHPTHAAILDKASTLTGGDVLSTKLADSRTN
jgi:hypothetical protein